MPGIAISIDSDLTVGFSNKSLTFKNEILSSTSTFKILEIEIWIFGDK